MKRLLFLFCMLTTFGLLLGNNESEKKRESCLVINNIAKITAFYMGVFSATHVLKKALDKPRKKNKKQKKIRSSLEKGLGKTSNVFRAPLVSVVKTIQLPIKYFLEDLKTNAQIFSAQSAAKKAHLRLMKDVRSFERTGTIIKACQSAVFGFGVPLIAMSCYQKLYQ